MGDAPKVASSFQYLTMEPTAALRPWVQQVFFARGEPGYVRETVVPMGHPTLLVNLGQPFTRKIDGGVLQPVSGGVLLFQQTRAAEHVFTAETHVVGAALVTDGAWPWMNADVSPYTDGMRALAALDPARWPGAEVQLRAQSADGEACMAALDGFLQTRIWPAPDRAVRAALAALQADPRRGIAELSRAAGLSHKQLIARFKCAVGATPKTLAMLLRMSAIMTSIAGAARPDWATVAADAGYADQAHFARTFRRFNGLTPGEYGRRRRWAHAAVGLEDASGFFVPTPEEST